MNSKKALIRGSLVVAGAMSAAPALAASYWVTNSSNLNGTANIVGPTTASYGGLPLPCSATFGLTDSAGSATVTSATFSGAGCTAIRPCNLPWSLGTPLNAINTTGNVRISGVCVYLPAPLNATCTGVVTGTLRNSGSAATFTFSGSLTGNGTPNSCAVSSRTTAAYPSGLQATPQVGINWP